MKCDRYTGADGTFAILCSRSRRAKPCSVVGCTKRATKLCDFPLTGAKAGKTCDRDLCDAHAVAQGRQQIELMPGLSKDDSRDYCPTHAEMARAGETGGAPCSAQVPTTAGNPPSPAGRPGDASAASRARTPLLFPIPPAAPASACRSCGASVVWIVTTAGKRMPVEATGERRGQSHFALCPQAGQWRQSR